MNMMYKSQCPKCNTSNLTPSNIIKCNCGHRYAVKKVNNIDDKLTVLFKVTSDVDITIKHELNISNKTDWCYITDQILIPSLQALGWQVDQENKTEYLEELKEYLEGQQ